MFIQIAAVLVAVTMLSPFGWCQSGRAVYESGDAWTDPATGLMWAKRDSGSVAGPRDDMHFDQARTYCTQLRLQGYSDWRLPTINELAAIYDKTQATPLAPPNPPVALNHIKGGIRLSGTQIWSSSPGRSSKEVWTFSYGGEGSRSSWDRDFGLGSRALCVRPSGQ